MVKVDETALPGLGMRYDFDGRFGKRVGVITHRDGRREIFVAPKDDPDATEKSVILTEDESAVVADLLGDGAGLPSTDFVALVAALRERYGEERVVLAEAPPEARRVGSDADIAVRPSSACRTPTRSRQRWLTPWGPRSTCSRESSSRPVP